MSFTRIFNRFRNRKTLDKQGPDGETVLTAAIKMGDLQGAAKFIDLGASVDAPNAKDEYPVFLTLAQKDKRFFQLLIEEDACVGKLQHGKTLLQCAEDSKRADAIDIIHGVKKQEQSYLNSIVISVIPLPAPPPSRSSLFYDKKRP